MLNHSEEEEGTMYVVGGGDTTITMKTTAIPVGRNHGIQIGFRPAWKPLGLEIHAGRGNSIRLLARMATVLDQSIRRFSARFRVAPSETLSRDAEACVFIPESDADHFKWPWRLQQTVNRTWEVGSASTCLSPRLNASAVYRRSPAIWKMLLALPHGPVTMSQAIVGLVETSSNMAQVTTLDGSVQILCNSRSMVGSAMEAVRESIRAVAGLAGADCELINSYPGWRPDMDSKVLKTARAL